MLRRASGVLLFLLIGRVQHAAESERPRLPSHKLLLLSFEGVDPQLVSAIAARIRAEYAVAVEEVAERFKPTEGTIEASRARYLDAALAGWREEQPDLYHEKETSLGLGQNPSTDEKEKLLEALDKQSAHTTRDWFWTQKYLRQQYDVTVLVEQIRGRWGTRIRKPDVIGLLAVTKQDIRAGSANYVFGQALEDEHVGVMSYERFARANAPPDLVRKRAEAQALSTTGRLLGFARCSRQTCALAGTANLAEHDLKEPKLCPACLEKLRAVYRERLKPLQGSRK